MSEEDLRQLIKTALGEDFPESVPNKSLKVPSFMIDHNYMENSSFYIAGKCEETEQKTQIDLYYADKNYLNVGYEAVKQVLIENGLYADSEKYRDMNNGFWRANFKIITEGGI